MTHLIACACSRHSASPQRQQPGRSSPFLVWPMIEKQSTTAGCRRGFFPTCPCTRWDKAQAASSLWHGAREPKGSSVLATARFPDQPGWKLILKRQDLSRSNTRSYPKTYPEFFPFLFLHLMSPRWILALSAPFLALLFFQPQ